MLWKILWTLHFSLFFIYFSSDKKILFYLLIISNLLVKIWGSFLYLSLGQPHLLLYHSACPVWEAEMLTSSGLDLESQQTVLLTPRNLPRERCRAVFLRLHERNLIHRADYKGSFVFLRSLSSRTSYYSTFTSWWYKRSSKLFFYFLSHRYL